MEIAIICLLLVFLLTSLAAFPARAENEKPLIGLAWHNRPRETFAATQKALEAAGGTVAPLGQVFSADLLYDKNGLLSGQKDEYGALLPEAAAPVRLNTWHGSNAADVLGNIAAVVFPGGDDISPALYHHPQVAETFEGCCGERDVSDYLLMTYCLDHDIPLLAICRGMQMLAVVSGADMIQDLDKYYAGLGKEYDHAHRREPPFPGGYRDFIMHDVTVTDKSSLLYTITGMDVLPRSPSWHHQAVKSIEGTSLKVTGVTPTHGVHIIEAIERTDKAFALGVQTHPEIAVVRGTDDYSIRFFEAIIRMAIR